MGALLLLATAALLLGGGSGSSPASPSKPKIPMPTPTPKGTPKLTGPFKLEDVNGGVQVTFDGPLSLYNWITDAAKQLGIGDDVRADMALGNIAARVTGQPIVGVKILSMGPSGYDEWDGESGIVEGASQYTVGELRARAETWLRARGML